VFDEPADQMIGGFFIVHTADLSRSDT